MDMLLVTKRKETKRNETKQNHVHPRNERDS